MIKPTFKLGITSKIVLGNCVFVAILVAAFVVMGFDLSATSAALDKQRAALAELDRYSEAKATFAETRYWLTEFSLGWLDEARRQADASLDQFEAILNGLDTVSEENRHTIAVWSTDYTTAMTSATVAYIDGDRLRGNQLASEARGHAQAINNELARLLEAAHDKTIAAGEAVGNANTRLRTKMAVVAALALIASVGMSIAIGRWVARRVRAVSERLHEIGTGEADLTQRLAVNTNDEFRELADNFNAFVGRLQRIVGQLRGQVVTVARSSGDLATTAESLNHAAATTKAESSQAANAVDKMSTTINSVGQSTEQVSLSVDRVSQMIGELTNSFDQVTGLVDDAAGVATTASDLAARTSESMGRLGKAADKIGSVVGVIRDISEQTNLLALNATIEAARAGESGKGFAVVAAEVKQLASQVSEATQDIADRTTAIQESSAAAAEDIHQIRAVIEQINGASDEIKGSVHQQRQTTSVIADDMRDSSELTREVASSIAGTLDVSRSVVERMSSVNAAAEQAATGAADTKQAGGVLSGAADALDVSVAEFVV